MKRRQRGGFVGLMRPMQHYIQSIANVAPRIMATAGWISKDMREGKSFKEAALDRIPESLKQASRGEAVQFGTGIRRRRISRKKRVKRKNGVHSRRVVRVCKKRA